MSRTKSALRASMTMMTRGPTLLLQAPGGLTMLLVSETPELAGLEGKKPAKKVEKRRISNRNLVTGWSTEGAILQTC